MKIAIRCCLVVLLALQAGGVFAGDCRDALRPLLLSSSPAPERLAAVRKFCAQARADGDADAGYQLALLDPGLDGWQPERATRLIESAAESGVPEAQYWLAWQYESGPLLPDDAALALRWYEAAAQREHRLALQRLAEAYADGELGLSPNPRRATEYRARAERCAQRSG